MGSNLSGVNTDKKDCIHVMCCPRLSALVQTDHVDGFLTVVASMCVDSLVSLRLSTAVMATKSRHVSEVMATMQINVAEQNN